MFQRNRLIRKMIRQFRNWKLMRQHTWLILGDNVGIKNSRLGRFNYFCSGAIFVNSSLGDYSYVGKDTIVGNAEIGKFCSIGPGVLIGLGKHPTEGFVSTHPIFYSTTFQTHNRFATEQAFEEYGEVKIGHDVWIGANAIVADDTTIGTGAIIAAGAVVFRDVAPYSIVGGFPAKEMRKRFEPSEIELLLLSRWWDRDDDWLKVNHKAFHSLEKFEQLLNETGSVQAN